MIFLIEPNLPGSGHSVLNAGAIVVLRAAFPGIPISFAARPTHLSHVQQHLSHYDLAPIRYVALPERPIPKTQIGHLRDVFAAYRTITENARLGDTKYLLYTSATGPSAHSALSLAARIRQRHSVWLHISLHGTNCGDFSWRTRNPFYRALDLVSAIKKSAKRDVRFLVLDESTIGAWTDLHPPLASRLGPLEVAILPSERLRLPARSLQGPPVRFGFLGQATESKGFPLFVQIANQVTHTGSTPSEFHLIGRLSAALASHATGPVIMHSDQPQQRRTAAMQLDRQVYLSAIARMDYICLPYATEYYHSGASGVFFDALNMGRPIIAMATPSTKRAFASFGDIGYLCDNAADFAATVAACAYNTDAHRYAVQVENVERARLHYLPDAVSRRFVRWLEAEQPSLYLALTAACRT